MQAMARANADTKLPRIFTSPLLLLLQIPAGLGNFRDVVPNDRAEAGDAQDDEEDIDDVADHSRRIFHLTGTLRCRGITRFKNRKAKSAIAVETTR